MTMVCTCLPLLALTLGTRARGLQDLLLLATSTLLDMDLVLLVVLVLARAWGSSCSEDLLHALWVLAILFSISEDLVLLLRMALVLLLDMDLKLIVDLLILVYLESIVF